jgi:mannosyl-oligosaccharide alpha-1,2-mannosidase
MIMAARLALLSILAASAAAESEVHTDTAYPPASYSSVVWWPNPPFVTESYGPISPHYSKPPVTTSLSSIPAYTYTSPPGYSYTQPPTATSYLNSTSPSGPSATANSTLGACKSIQYDFPAGQGGNADRADAIKQAYLDGWNAYVNYAFGKDELQPLNASGVDNWFGWGVTIVDAIDTAIIMDLRDVVAKQLAFIQTIDFNTTPYGPVEIFDVSIRYLGGLIAAYDLLKSGQFYNDYPQDQIDALLSQAVSLANKIAYGFDSPTGLASTNVNFTSDEPVFGTYTVAATNVTYNSTNTASTGTFILDWFRLSDQSGNQSYRQLSERAESYLVNPDPAPVFPGLIGTQFDVDTGKMLTFDGGWEAGVDSALEYMIKTYQYQQTAVTTQYKDFWLQAVQSTIQYIALHPYGFPDLTFLSELDVNGTIAFTQDDFSCFAGGNFLLGAKLLDMPELIDLGIAVTDGCHQTYNTTLTGLGPIEWQWYNSSNLAYDPLRDNDAPARKWAAKYGYFIPEGDENWSSRPEPTESLFYAHRITGDPRWAEYAWQVFQAINTTARNPIAFATVNNVNMPFGGSMSNNLDS